MSDFAPPVIRVNFAQLVCRRHQNFIFYMLCILSLEECARKMFEWRYTYSDGGKMGNYPTPLWTAQVNIPSRNSV